MRTGKRRMQNGGSAGIVATERSRNEDRGTGRPRQRCEDTMMDWADEKALVIANKCDADPINATAILVNEVAKLLRAERAAAIRALVTA